MQADAKCPDVRHWAVSRWRLRHSVRPKEKDHLRGAKLGRAAQPTQAVAILLCLVDRSRAEQVAECHLPPACWRLPHLDGLGLD